MSRTITSSSFGSDGPAIVPRIGQPLAGLARRADLALTRIACRRRLAIFVVGLASFVAGASMSLIKGLPHPKYHDEFAYLLAADTFDKGRLANPTHPFWPHFETMHVLQRPAYASKYPPGQGLLLVLGRRIGGREAVGAWLGNALACASACWMLMAWVRPRWAFAGGLLAATNQTVLDWGQSYWGGGLAMLGGSLLLGGARRAASRPGWREGTAMGAGMALLAVSRPYEGMVLTLATLAALAFWRARAGAIPAVLATFRTLPAVLVPLSLAVGLTLALNVAVTGHASRLVYAEYEEQYTNTPALLIQKPANRPISYRNEAMRSFYEGWTADSYDQAHRMTPLGLASFSLLRALAIQVPAFATIRYDAGEGLSFNRNVALLWVPWLLIQLPLFLRPQIAWGRGARDATLLLGVFTAALSLEVWKATHYAAPAFGLVLLLTVRSLRQWGAVFARHHALGLAARRALFVLALAWPWPVALASRARATPDFASNRATAEARLLEAGGDHLVIVRYGPDHDPHQEWVYNRADIDGSRVVWARDLGDEPNRRLLDHFRGRNAWLLEPDSRPLDLVPYPTPPATP